MLLAPVIAPRLEAKRWPERPVSAANQSAKQVVSPRNDEFHWCTREVRRAAASVAVRRGSGGPGCSGGPQQMSNVVVGMPSLAAEPAHKTPPLMLSNRRFGSSCLERSR